MPGSATAHPYDRHVGRYGKQLAAGMLAASGIRAGDRALDVGCGTGQLTAALSAAAGSENVAAIDPSESALEACRQRVPGADVRVGVAESLPFAEGEFDVVLAQLVVNLVDDPPRAVREMARVARTGGVVAACVWDDDEMPLLRAFWDAAPAAAPRELETVNAQAQVGLPDLGLLRRWWQQAELEDPELTRIEVTAAYESFDDLWFSFEAGIGHSGGLYVSLTPRQQAALRSDAHRRLGSPAGRFRLAATAWIMRGVR